MKEITKLEKTSPSDFKLHAEERKSGVLPDLHQFIEYLHQLFGMLLRTSIFGLALSVSTAQKRWLWLQLAV